MLFEKRKINCKKNTTTFAVNLIELKAIGTTNAFSIFTMFSHYQQFSLTSSNLDWGAMISVFPTEISPKNVINQVILSIIS